MCKKINQTENQIYVDKMSYIFLPENIEILYIYLTLYWKDGGKKEGYLSDSKC